MSVLPVCMPVYHVHAWCAWRSGERKGSLGTRVIDCCEPSSQYQESNLGSLEEQPLLFNNQVTKFLKIYYSVLMSSNELVFTFPWGNDLILKVRLGVMARTTDQG